MAQKSRSVWSGIAAIALAALSALDSKDPSRGGPLPSKPRHRKNWWRAGADSLQIFIALLTISSFITALKFFQAQDYVAAIVHTPVAITDFERFSEKDTIVSDKILPCIHAAIPKTLDGQEYTVRVATVATLMNPPFLLKGKKFVFMYEIGASSPTFVPPYSTAPANAPTPSAQIPDSENPFTEPNMLKAAKYNAGYGPYEKEKSFNISLKQALSSPHKLKHYLQNRYGIVMFEAELPKRALYLVEDIFPACIDPIEPPHLKRAGYYRLTDSREIWNVIELKNISGNPIHDATLAIDRPGEGETGLVEATIKPDGGEILHKSTYFTVVRFPTILEHSSKIVLIKTKGRPIDRSALEVAHSKTSSPSIPLMLGLAAFSLLVAGAYLFLCPGTTDA